MEAGEWTEEQRRQWRRPPADRQQRRRDVVIGLVVVAGSLLATLLANSAGMLALGQPPSLTEQFLWNIALATPLVVRTRYPVTVLMIVGAVFIAAQFRQVAETVAPSVVLFLAIYTVGAWTPNRVVARNARLIVIIAMFAWLGYLLVIAVTEPTPRFDNAAGPLDPLLAIILYNIVFNLVFFGAAYHFGNVAWLSARRQAEMIDRAEQLRLSQQRNIRGAVVDERVRIARDLHDVVAHHVAVMGVQAAAARRVLDRDPSVASDALRSVEETARSAVGELRGLLWVLRSDAPEDEKSSEVETDENAHRSTPDLQQLPELVASARNTGLEVTYGVYGDAQSVPDGVAVSAYRVVQEALTNVIKHAGPCRVDVRVRYRASSLEIEVTDNGRGAGEGGKQGFGLLGMRERVAVHNGEVEFGPRPGGGFRVRVTFPLAAPATTAEGAS